MSSGAISKQLGSLWKRAGIFKVDSGKRNVCATLFRKGASTGVRHVKVGDSQEIADLMAHSLSTAEKLQYTRRKINTAASASKAVRSYFQSGEVSSFSTPTKIIKTSLVEDGALKVKRKKWTASEKDLLKIRFAMTRQ